MAARQSASDPISILVCAALCLAETGARVQGLVAQEGGVMLTGCARDCWRQGQPRAWAGWTLQAPAATPPSHLQPACLPPAASLQCGSKKPALQSLARLQCPGGPCLPPGSQQQCVALCRLGWLSGLHHKRWWLLRLRFGWMYACQQLPGAVMLCACLYCELVRLPAF